MVAVITARGAVGVGVERANNETAGAAMSVATTTTLTITGVTTSGNVITYGVLGA